MSSSSKLSKVLDVSLVISFICAGFYMDIYWNPAKRGFSCDDTSIRLRRLGNTVTPLTLLLSLVFPHHTMLLLDLCFLRVPSREAYDCYISYLFGVSLLHVTSNLLKYGLGMFRPHFLDACQPDWSKIDCSQGLVLDYQCQKTDKIQLARTSFPSGHAAYSCFSMLYCICYIQKRFMNGRYRHRIWTCAQTLCVAWATYVAFTRVLDGWHHVMDVIAGCMMGTAMAVAMVIEWSPLCDRHTGMLPSDSDLQQDRLSRHQDEELTLPINERNCSRTRTFEYKQHQF